MMKNTKTPYKSVLTIAGSDSGGCAGIQADIKSISACGAYAASVITATTAQNTLGVTDIHPIPISHIEKQLDAVFGDISFDAIKIGMLHSCEVIELIATKLTQYQAKNIVIDPVMTATSGDLLITNEAIQSLKTLLPQAHLITPNTIEAEILIGQPIDKSNSEETAAKIGQKFNTSVLLKGGHFNDDNNEMFDVLYNIKHEKTLIINHPRIHTNNIHGTGCSLSSSIATFLSKGDNLETATQKACEYINKAIDNGKDKMLGQGNGPINHFGLL